MNHFSCTQKSQYGSHFVHTMRQRSLLCDIIGAWISNQEQRHVSKSALKAANGSRTTLIDCNYKTRLKTQKRPKKIKMKKRNGGLALPRNPSQLSNTNQYSSGILVYVCCIQFPWHQFNQKKNKRTRTAIGNTHMAIKQICKSNAQERHLRQHESPLYKDK